MHDDIKLELRDVTFWLSIDKAKIRVVDRFCFDELQISDFPAGDLQLFRITLLYISAIAD